MEGKDDSNVEKALEGALGRKGRPGRNRESLEDSSHIGSLAGSRKAQQVSARTLGEEMCRITYRAINNAADVAKFQQVTSRRAENVSDAHPTRSGGG
jgi:hypothetical protein